MKNPIYFHSNTTPRVCVCGLPNEDGTQLKLGVARCSKKSQYVKSIGRKIAQGRASKHPIDFLKISDEPFSKKFVEKASELAIKVSENAARVKISDLDVSIQAEINSYVLD